jgi:hypothetical protein
MRSQVDDKLIREAERYAFRFCCEACSHFDAERVMCGEGYPTQPHHRIDLNLVKSLEFCKAFELG